MKKKKSILHFVVDLLRKYCTGSQFEDSSSSAAAATTTTNMPIRQAHHSDIPQLAEILAASFGPDKLFQVTFPFQNEHPEYLVRAFRQKLIESWWSNRKVVMCSYCMEKKEED